MDENTVPLTETEALQRYQALSYELNPSLWAGHKLRTELEQHVKVLDLAASRHRNAETMTVYRAGTWREGALAQGSVISFPGFTSATRHREYTRQFMPSDCRPAALFTIHCPIGTPHAPIGEMEELADDEAEILLGRDLRFVVDGVHCITDRQKILDYVGPDPQEHHSEVWDVTLTVEL